MNKSIFLLLLCVNFVAYPFGPHRKVWGTIEQHMQQMDDEMAQVHRALSSLYSTRMAHLSINNEDVILISQEGNTAIITVTAPGMKKLEAYIEDGKLRIIDLENQQNSIEIVVDDTLVRADIQYEYHEKEKDDEHQRIQCGYFHSTPILKLPGKLDLSNHKTIDISYDDGILTIKAPFIAKPVQSIPVQVVTSSQSKTQTTVETSKKEQKTDPEPKHVKFSDTKQVKKEVGA